MANLQNRTRVLYVRVSDQEFQRLKDLCQEHGAKNMSDLVRSSVDTLRSTRDASFEHEIRHCLQKVENALDDLRKTVALIAEGKIA